jgi:hypothetical protein
LGAIDAVGVFVLRAAIANRRYVMRLTTRQIEHTLDQIEAQPIPEDNPVIPQLSKAYGDHTFFLDREGLNIVETLDDPEEGETATVVRLGSWADANHTTLATHEPQVTDVTVDVGPEK